MRVWAHLCASPLYLLFLVKYNMLQAISFLLVKQYGNKIISNDYPALDSLNSSGYTFLCQECSYLLDQ